MATRELRRKIASARVLFPSIEKLIHLCRLKGGYKEWSDEYGYRINLETKRVVCKINPPLFSYDIFFKSSICMIEENSYWGIYCESSLGNRMGLIGNDGRLRVFDFDGVRYAPLSLGYECLEFVSNNFVEESGSVRLRVSGIGKCNCQFGNLPLQIGK